MHRRFSKATKTTTNFLRPLAPAEGISGRRFYRCCGVSISPQPNWMHYLKHSLILATSIALFVLLVAGLCSLVVYIPSDLTWKLVVAVTLGCLGLCPFVGQVILLLTAQFPARVFDLIASSVISVLAVPLLNSALNFFIHQLSGRDISPGAWRLLTLNALGCAMGLIVLWRSEIGPRRRR